jgi:PAS domain S-box-containing protein
MKTHKSPRPPAGTIRQEAEKRLKEQVLPGANDLSQPDARALVQELHVHHIELQMQNEELRRAQGAAQEAQQKYAELFDFAPVGYFLVDEVGLIREANLTGADLLGRDRSGLIGQPVAKLIAPDSRPHFSTFWSHLRETDTKQSCEVTLLMQGQSLRPVVLQAAFLEDVSGGRLRFLLAVTDITTRKEAEETLRAAYGELERRVEERTAQLQQINVRLAEEIEQVDLAREDLGRQLRFESLLADLSARFVNVPVGEVDREIMDAQRRLCEFLGIDISALRQWSDEAPGLLPLTVSYSAQEGPQPPRQLKEEDFPWIAQQMRAGRSVAIASLEDLPAEAARDREACRQLGIQSSLCLPLSVGGKAVGILGLNTTRAKRAWPEALVKWLQLVAQILANALARKGADLALRAGKERLSLAADAAEAGLWELDCQTQVFWATDKALALFEYLSCTGKPVSRLPCPWSSTVE